MNVLFSRLAGSLALAVLFLISSATVVAQNTWTVGPGGQFSTLEQLRNARDASNRVLFRDGDTIVLNRNDTSLQGAFAQVNLTFRGTGRILPAGSNSFYNNNNINGNVTLNSNSFEFSGFTNGVITARDVNIVGGSNAFIRNTAGAIRGNTNISGGTNTFSANTITNSPYTNDSGGAIRGSTTITGGTNTFSDNTVIAPTNTSFTSNCSGGAIRGSTTITGGTNTFTDNAATGVGGAISTNDGVLRATDGDFTFQGNRDRVGTVNEKANAIAAGTLTLAAEEGRSIYFYDPVTAGNGSLSAALS